MTALLHALHELEVATRCLQRADQEQDLPAYHYYRDRVEELAREVVNATLAL